MRITFALTSTAVVDETWTTMHLAQAALELGHTVRFVEPTSFEITSAGKLVARAWLADRPSRTREVLTRRLVSGTLQRRYIELVAGDMLMLRVNPLTLGMLTFAVLARDTGVVLVNDPLGIVRTRSKAWLASLRDVPIPATIVTASRATVHTFAKTLAQPVVIKPASGSGGRGVRLVPRRQAALLDHAVDTARTLADLHVVAQEYLPAAEAGEKRLVWVDGQVLGGYLRHRSPGEFRHNLHQGAQPAHCDIEGSDLEIARAIGPHLARNGIRIAGLDVIGDRLVEVNTVNPGGIHYSEAIGGAVGIAQETIRLLAGPTSGSIPEASHA